MPETDNIAILYNTLSKDYNDLGSYDEFSQKMSDPVSRKRFYDVVGGEYNLGENFNAFEQKILKKKSRPKQDVSQKSLSSDQESSQALKSPSENIVPSVEGSDIYTPDPDQSFNMQKWIDMGNDPQVLPESLEEAHASFNPEDTTVKQTKEFLAKQITPMYKEKAAEARSAVEAILEEKYSGMMGKAMRGDISMKEKMRLNKEKQQSVLALKTLDEIDAKLNAAEDGAGEAAKYKIKHFEDVVTLGWTKVADKWNLKGIADKVENRETVSEEENMALALHGMKRDIDANIDTPIDYSLVSGLIDMVPYMAQFALTGGATTAAQTGLNKAMNVTAQKTMANYAKRGASYLLANAPRPLAFSSFYEQAGEKQLQGESPFKSWAKAYGNTYAEVATEGFMDDVVRAGKLGSGKGISKVREAVKVGSAFEEFSEEIVSAAGQAGIEGEKLEDVLTPRMLFETFILTSAVSTAFNVGQSLEGARKKANQNRAAMTDLGSKLSSEEKKKVDDVIDRVEGENPKSAKEASRKMEQVIDEGVKDKDWTENKVKDVSEYAARRHADNAHNEAEVLSSQPKQTEEGAGVKTEPKTQPKQENASQKTTEPQKSKETPIKKEEKATLPLKGKESSQSGIKEGVKETIIPEKVQVDSKKESKVSEKDTKVEQKPKEDGKKEGLQETQTKSEEVNLTEPSPATKAEKGVVGIKGDAETVRIKSGDKDVGRITYTSDDGSYQARWVESEGAKGTGTKAYDVLNKKAEKEGKVVRSDKTILPAGRGLWNSLVKNDKAVKLDDGTFVMKNKFTDKYLKDVEATRKLSEKASTEKGADTKQEGVQQGSVRDTNPPKEKARTEEEYLAEAQTINEVQDLLSSGKVKFSPKYNKRLSEVRSREIKEGFEKEEMERKETPEGSSFFPFSNAIKQTLERASGKKGAVRTTKGLFSEYFRTARGLPKKTYDATIGTKGKINSRLYDVEKDTKAAIKLAEKVYDTKKLSDPQYEVIQTALETMGTTPESRAKALKDIPKELHEPLTSMRKNIDSITEELKKLELISPGLEVKFDENKGYYMTRTYKKHTDKNWRWENIPRKIKEDATILLSEYYPEATLDEVKGMARTMLESNDVSGLVAGNNFKVNKDILKKRSDFLTDNPEIRKLLGENRDPFYNYAVSMTKMIEMAERGKLVEDIRNQAITEGWGSEKPSDAKNHVAKITGKPFKSEGLNAKSGSPLSEFYVTPEMAEVINNFDKARQVNSVAGKLYLQAMNRVKLAKTAQSVKSQMRNVKSNTFNYVANGNWINIPETYKELHTRLKTPEARRDFIKELKERVIIDDSVHTGEVMDNIKRMSNHLSFLQDIDKSTSLNALQKFDRATLKAYGLGDDVWKAGRYVSEYLNYEKAYMKGGMDAEQARTEAKAKAAKVLHNTSTYYSMLPKLMQQLRNLPTNGTFISFPYLTARNFLGTMQIAASDLKNPHTAHIGVSRLLGTTASVVALTAAAGLKNKKEGLDEEDMAKVRRFLPDFWKNDIITIKKNKGDGTFLYNNSSYLDYYNQVTRPVQMFYRDIASTGEVTNEDITEVVTEMFEPFMSWDILFDRATNLKSNKDNNGSQIWNPSDNPQDKFDDQFWYIMEAFEPATLTDARRIRRAVRTGGEWEPALRGVLTGSQTREIDVIKSMDWYKLPDTKEKIKNDAYIYKKEKRKFDRIQEPTRYDIKKKNDAYERSMRALSKTVEDARLDYEAAIDLGADTEELQTVIRKHKMDRDITNAILFGGEWTIDEETGSIKGYVD